MTTNNVILRPRLYDIFLVHQVLTSSSTVMRLMVAFFYIALEVECRLDVLSCNKPICELHKEKLL